jgi:GNAT superfamily N-acetyltransferase
VKQVETVVTYLEMRAPPAPEQAPVAPPREGLALVHAQAPTVAFYRRLYEAVGAPWLWTDRSKLDDAALAAIVRDPAVEVWVLWSRGVPAGYVELDRRAPPEIELAYFGLVPEFLGQRLGPYLLDQAIRRAWSYAPARFWVHTQTLDHPAALPLYQKLGFVAYKTETIWVDDPRS